MTITSWEGSDEFLLSEELDGLETRWEIRSDWGREDINLGLFRGTNTEGILNRLGEINKIKIRSWRWQWV